MQAIFGSAKAPIVSPVLIGSNIATVDGTLVTPFIFTTDVNFGNEGGSNRLLVIVYGSEGGFSADHTTPLYDGIAGVVVDSKSQSSLNRAAIISAHYWKEADLPSSAGLYEFSIQYANSPGGGAGNSQGHHVRAFLFKNVDQTTPVGLTMASLGRSGGVPTFQMSITAISLQETAGIVAIQTAIIGSTYVSGDHKDNQSNMNDIVEQQARPNADTFGGGAFASAHDVVPDSNEDYIWDVKYGTSTSVNATLAIAMTVNVIPQP